MKTTSEIRIEISQRRQRIRLNGVKVLAKHRDQVEQLIVKLRSTTGRRLLYKSDVLNVFVDTGSGELTVIGDQTRNAKRLLCRVSIPPVEMAELLRCVDLATKGEFKKELAYELQAEEECVSHGEEDCFSL